MSHRSFRFAVMMNRNPPSMRLPPQKGGIVSCCIGVTDRKRRKHRSQLLPNIMVVLSAFHARHFKGGSARRQRQNFRSIAFSRRVQTLKLPPGSKALPFPEWNGTPTWRSEKRLPGNATIRSVVYSAHHASPSSLSCTHVNEDERAEKKQKERTDTSVKQSNSYSTVPYGRI